MRVMQITGRFLAPPPRSMSAAARGALRDRLEAFTSCHEEDSQELTGS